MSLIYASPAYAAYDLLITAIDLTRACCAHELYDLWIGLYASALNGSRGIADYLFLAAVAEPEQLVGVAVLFVVVDQARVGRRGDHASRGARQPDCTRVAVEHVESICHGGMHDTTRQEIRPAQAISMWHWP